MLSKERHYTLKMYNKTRLFVTVKRFRSKNGSDFINTTTLNIYWWTFDAVSILNVYEAALTNMISVNHINDNVQYSEITFDHICVDL